MGSSVAVVVLIAGPMATGCTGSTPTAASQTPPAAICDRALGHPAASVEATTVGDIRTTNFGGPSPGIVPGVRAFRGISASARAAWCWVLDPNPSPGADGSSWV